MHPDQIKGYPPVKYGRMPWKLAKEFKRALDAARDERPLQRFFEANPAALLTGILAPHTAFVIPRKALPKPEGGCWIPDFMLCDWASIGPVWTIVELESPKANPLLLRGDLSAKMRTAQQQIEDYRRHLRKNAAFLRDGGWPQVENKVNAWIVIGRRRPTTVAERERLAAFREYDIEIATYDRLLESCTERIKMDHGSWRSLKELIKRTNWKNRSAERPTRSRRVKNEKSKLLATCKGHRMSMKGHLWKTFIISLNSLFSQPSSKRLCSRCTSKPMS